MHKPNWLKSTIIFLSAQTLTLFGSSLVQYAIMWYITLTTGSGLMMTISILCSFIPSLLISPFAGVLADKYNKKLVIIISDSTIAFATLILAILTLSGSENIWLMFVVQAVRSFGTGVQSPTVGALIPELVPEEKLSKVNGINGSIQSVIMLISPALAAALLSAGSIGYLLLIDVVTAIIANTILLAFLKYKFTKSKEPHKGVYIEMREGWRYIKKNKYLKVFFVFSAFFYFLITPGAFLTSLQTTRNFGTEVWKLSAVEIFFSSGMILGGLVVFRKIFTKHKLKTLIISTLFMSFFSVLLGLIKDFYIYLAIMGLFGISLPFFTTPATVMLQEGIDKEYLGRVFSVYSIISNSILPLSMLIFGPLADVVSIDIMMVATGVLLFILTIAIRTRLINAQSV